MMSIHDLRSTARARRRSQRNPLPGGYAVALGVISLLCALAALVAFPILHWMGKLGK